VAVGGRGPTLVLLHIGDFARLAAAALDGGEPGRSITVSPARYPTAGSPKPSPATWAARPAASPPAEAAGVRGELGALIMDASSRSRAHRTRADLDWAPEHTDMLSMVGEPRLRALSIG
jgi:hypothetical protein